MCSVCGGERRPRLAGSWPRAGAVVFLPVNVSHSIYCAVRDMMRWPRPRPCRELVWMALDELVAGDLYLFTRSSTRVSALDVSGRG